MFRKSARGLFDLLMAGMAVATLLTTTPAGELLLRGGRWALGVRGKQTELIAYFGGTIGSERPTPTGFQAPEATSALTAIARAHGAAPSVLKGFLLASAPSAERSELLVELTSEGRDLLTQRGAREPELATGPGRLKAVSQAIADLGRDLGSDDAALSALVVGLEPVRYAVERVRAERRPPTLEALAPHLGPGRRQQVVQTVGLALTLATAYDLVWPVPKDTRISSPFGSRMHPVTRMASHHTGVDLSVPVGTPIATTGRGVVKRAGEDGINGRFLVVDHGRGITTAYCHNDELKVLRGAAVEQGALISLSGNTGRSTGPHLHYQVMVDGLPVDPLLLFSDGDRALLGVKKPAPPPPKPATPVPGRAVRPTGASARQPGAAAPRTEPAPQPGPAAAQPEPAPQPVDSQPEPAPAAAQPEAAPQPAAPQPELAPAPQPTRDEPQPPP